MADLEKITINMNVVDLGKIDLLVEEGFYSNRTDFIRTAIRNQINTHAGSIEQNVTRKSFAVGVLLYNHKDLEKHVNAGTQLEIKIIGMLILSEDIPPELAKQAIKSIKLYGVLKTSDAVRNILADRIS